ncbi:MAG: hypothetical protein AB1733_18925 [Thermodesulfobacteriota bacterium]
MVRISFKRYVNGPSLAAIWIATLGLVRVLMMAGHSQEVIVAHVPDDAFYYLMAAKNFATGWYWSFDGHNPATGFHLLFGYLVASAYCVWESAPLQALLLIFGCASIVLVSFAAYWVVRASTSDDKLLGGTGAVFVFTSTIALVQPTLLMESCFVIFFGSLLLFLISTVSTSNPDEGMAFAVVCFSTGLLGTLSRSDFAVLPWTLFGVYQVAYLLKRDYGSPYRIVSLAALGSLLGLLIVSCHCYIVSGNLYQASVVIKSHWGQTYGYDLRQPIQLVSKLALISPASGPISGEVALSALTIMAFLTAYSNWHGKDKGQSLLVIGCTVCIVVYLLIYAQNSGSLQIWYIGVFVPLAAFIANVALQSVRHVFLNFIIFTYVIAMSLANLAASVQPIWPHQAAMRDAGLFLKARPHIRPVASWNAGIIGFFAERPVINLDGLMNDSIIPYVLKNQVLNYVEQNQIKFICDFRAMISDPLLAERGGYPSGTLARRLIHEAFLSEDRPELRWHDTRISLFRVSGIRGEF